MAPQDDTIFDICTAARGDGMDEEDESREAECAPKGKGDDYLCAVVDAVHVVVANAAETAIEPRAAAEAFASAVSPCAESPAALAAFGADGVNQYVDAGVPWLAQAFPSAPVEKLHRALNLLWSPIRTPTPIFFGASPQPAAVAELQGIEAAISNVHNKLREVTNYCEEHYLRVEGVLAKIVSRCGGAGVERSGSTWKIPLG